MRTAAGLTLTALGELAGGYAPQYVSEVERAKTAATPAFIAAVDRALDALGALEALLPAAMCEHRSNAVSAPSDAAQNAPGRRYAVSFTATQETMTCSRSIAAACSARAPQPH
jgi:hypothetical protein